jgi:uncharacterized tellurite resistance protein B-like protein
MSGLFSLPFFSRSQMNSKEKSLILRACVSVACADGDMSTGEIETLKSSAADFGGFHAGDIDKAIAENKGLDAVLLQDLKALPPQKAHVLLKSVFLISNADGNITEHELASIKKVSDVVMPGKPWSVVHQWIGSYKTFVDATRTLFAEN